jgi:hypothetical protein
MELEFRNTRAPPWRTQFVVRMQPPHPEGFQNKTYLKHKHRVTPRLRKRAWHCRVEEMLISTGSNLEALVSSNASPRVVHRQGHSFHARRIHPLLSEPEENISRLSVSKGTRRRSKSERAMEAPNPHLSVQNLQEFPTLGLLAAYLMSTPPSLLPGTIMHMAPLVNHVGQPHH